MTALSVDLEHNAVIQQLGLHISQEGQRDYCRFSESPLWALQRQYFMRQGVNASRLKDSASMGAADNSLAEKYADVIMAYWEDAWAGGQLDPSQPLYILELGAGSGAFAYALLRSLEGKILHSPLHELNWCLLVSDMVQQNIDFMENHFRLQPFFERGRLDSLCLDAEAETETPISKRGLSLKDLANPIVAVVNDVYGGLTQELLHVHFGNLFEGRVALGKQEEHRSGSGPSSFMEKQERLDNPFADIVLHYEWQESNHLEWFPEELRTLLADYRRTLDSTALLIPRGALSCVKKLLNLSARRCLLLSCDYGTCHEQQLRNQSPPQLYAEGHFSLPVNYHLLENYAAQEGGLAWSSQCPESGLVVSACLFADKTGFFGNTQHIINRSLLDFTHGDQLRIRASLVNIVPALSFAEILSFLKLCRFDMQVLAGCLPYLLENFNQLSPGLRQEACEVLEQCWRQYYPTANDVELLNQLSLLLIDLQNWGVAREVLDLLLDMAGDNPQVLHNCALVELHLGEWQSALSLLESGLNREQDPGAQYSHQLKKLAVDLLDREQNLPWYKGAVSHCPASGLRLKPISYFDAGSFHYQYRDPNIGVLTRLPDFEDCDAVAQWLEEEITIPNKATYSVIHPHHGFVGSVCLRFQGDCSYFYFWVGTDHQRRGFGPAAARLAFEQAKAMGVKRVFTSAYHDNWRSRRALGRLGFQELDVSAAKPDQDLIFYTLALTEEEAEKSHRHENLAQELEQLLKNIESPISLQLS